MHAVEVRKSVLHALLRRWFLLAGLVPAAVGVAQGRAVAAGCTVPEPAMAQDLFDDWNAALKTQHPDRVTRLFAADGALLGFASPVARAGYMPIRDYFLYFLQFEPKARVTDRKVETGCNFLIDHGTYVWTLKSRTTGATETREARYRFIYELSGGQWRIAQHVDALAGTAVIAGFAVPPPLTPRVAIVDGSTGAAVAGFVKRIEPAPPQSAPARLQGPATKPSSRESDDTPEAGSDTASASKNRPRTTPKRSPAEPRTPERFSPDRLYRDAL